MRPATLPFIFFPLCFNQRLAELQNRSYGGRLEQRRLRCSVLRAAAKLDAYAAPRTKQTPTNRRFLPRSVEYTARTHDEPIPLHIIRSKVPVFGAGQTGCDSEGPKISVENLGDLQPGFVTKLSVSARSQLDSLDNLSSDQKVRLVQKINIEAQARQNLDPNVSLRILYHDAHICVAVKPSGILSVPGPRRNPSLANLVYDFLKPNGVMLDQMVVHRLDMATSGIIVYALSIKALRHLHSDFSERRVLKTYEALVHGHLEFGEGEVDVLMERDPDNLPFMRLARPRRELQPGVTHKFSTQNPKPSLTSYEVVSREHYQSSHMESPVPVTRLGLKPHTGRTHQLRVHCASALRSPIVGDDIYFSKGIGVDGESLLLHAKRLCIYHPITQAPMLFESPSPF